MKNLFLTVLKDKLQWLAQKLEKETQLSVLNDYLELSGKILGLIEKIKDF